MKQKISIKKKSDFFLFAFLEIFKYFQSFEAFNKKTARRIKLINSSNYRKFQRSKNKNLNGNKKLLEPLYFKILILKNFEITHIFPII